MKTVAAIDFGTSKIVTLLAASGGFTRCDIIGSGTVPYDGFIEGKWNTPDMVPVALRESINAAEVESKHKITEAYVGVPGDFIRVYHEMAEIEVTAEDGRVGDGDIDKVQDAAAGRLSRGGDNGVIIHRSPAWFSVDGGKNTMSPIGVRGSTLRAGVSFITADPGFIHDVRVMLGRLNVTPLAFLSPTMGASLLLLPPDERDKVSVLIDVGYLNTEISIVQGDAILYHQIRTAGGGHISVDLAERLDISLHAAEQIKRDYIFLPDEFDAQSDPEVRFENGKTITYPLAYVQQTVENTVDEIIGLIKDTLEDRKGDLGARSQIYLTGGGIAMMRGGREYMAEKLGRTVKIPLARAAKLNSPRYASSLGLVDLIFDSLEQQSPGDDSLASRLSGGIKNLFNR